MSKNTISLKIKKLSISAALTSLALIFSYIEFLIPFSFGNTGIKLGLANVVILVALYTLGASYAFSINLLRVVLSGLLFGNVFAIAYSFAGALFSFLCMLLLKKTNWFSIIGVSMAGGVAHNLGQIIIAAFLVESMKIFYYFPVLVFSGMITGILIGVIAHFLCNRINQWRRL
ncbi:Gx transporter family protein [Sinanaerobacter sp. ZZT-01]|uniref:Gx transporter family protein n=1 Tax=Sinanaerobacter sp. ZZT-01 TaxID=3111540 RepID=UPI002D7878E8|nr:Gx transporter family protein [Sinanaerobacter sp. ZZT-01]WRR94449.1 Gx transporter family protein [Sinanaerobacter sp. ZZT-01]